MKDQPPERRSYPAAYEKLIPIVLGLIVLGIVVVLVIAAGLVFGFVSAN